MNLTLFLTHDCNLDCSYCYAGRKRKQTMPWDTAKHALDFAFASVPSALQLGYFGGEPLLAWDILMRSTEHAEALAAAHETQLKKTVTTNATLLDPQRLAWLQTHAFYPALSIDGNRTMQDITRPLRGGGSSFAACMQGLDLARRWFPEVEVILVPDPANIQHLVEGVRFLVEEKGVVRIAINPNFYATWPPEALDLWEQAFEDLGDFYLQRCRNGHAIALNFIDGKIITRLKDGFECCDRCDFGENEIAVAPSGRIYPCERVVTEDDNDELCIGTVFDGFDAAKRKRILAKRGNVNAECLTCAIRTRCMNWCCCVNYALTGAIDRTDGIVCFHERLAVRVADRVGAALFAEKNPLFLARFYYEDFDLPGPAGNG